jgi:two-component system secretion response regulator SsrB
MGNEDARRLRVLIADDNARLVRAISRLLSLDHDVVGSVVNGSGLLEAARQLTPDVVVLDLSLGDGESLEACRQLTQRNPAMKVIVFTAEDDLEVRRRAFEAGASAFVDKLLGNALVSAVTRLHDEAK